MDGGKGQLSAAYDALASLGLEDLPLISLAKKEEEVFVVGSSEPIVLDKNSHALKLLTRIRDEAHRFAVTYHRSAAIEKDRRLRADEDPVTSGRRAYAACSPISIPSETCARRASRSSLPCPVWTRAAPARSSRISNRMMNKVVQSAAMRYTGYKGRGEVLNG